MKTRLHALLGVLVLTVSAPVSGQESVGTTSESVASSETGPLSEIEQTHDAIRALRDTLIAAVNGKDVDSLLSLLDENVILTAQDGDRLATVRKRDGVKEYIDRLLTGPDAAIETMTVKPAVDELTTLYGNDAGVASGSSEDQYTLKDGAEFTLKTRWSATVVNTGRGWKVASLHVSSNLFDNPVLEAISSFALIGGLAAGLGGLVIGFGLARLLRRKSVA